MVKRQRRLPIAQVFRKNSEDGLLSKKDLKPCETLYITNFEISMHSAGSKRNFTSNNRPSISNSSYFPNSRKNSKLRKAVSVIDESSCSEDTEIVHRRRKPTLRALSDYESGDNDVEKAGSSLASFSKVNTRGLTTTEDVCCNSIQYKNSSSSESDELFTIYRRRGSMRRLSDYENGDSTHQPGESLLNLSRVDQTSNNIKNFEQSNGLNVSPESDSVHAIDRNKFKRPHDLFSPCGSSDSDTPVRQQRFRKRKKISSSSEESDDKNQNVAQPHRRGRRSQNDLPRTNGSIEYTDTSPQVRRRLRPRFNGGIEYTDTRPQVRRRLRPRINSQRSYIETDSDSSDVEMLSSVIVSQETGEYSFTINIDFNNRQDSLIGNSSSDDHLNRRVHTAINERNTESTQQINRPQNTRRPMTRHQIRKNNEIEARRISSLETDSEAENRWSISSEENIGFSRFRRCSSESQSQQLQSYFDSSDTDVDSLFKPRRARGRAVQIHYSDSDSNTEQTHPVVGNSSGTSNSDISLHPIIPSIIQDENVCDSDVDSEKCPICFSCFGSKEVASPSSCDHSYCTECILEWAKSNNTCPIDRKLFNKIIVRPNFNGEVIREIPVETPNIATRFWVSDVIDDLDPIFTMAIDVSSSEEEEEEEICCVCYSSNNSQNLILCDFCNNIYHMSCLTPPLRYVPASDWFCPSCAEFEMASVLY